MGHHSCCNQQKVKRGLWSPEEDEKLITYIRNNAGYGCWSEVPEKAGLQRCGKSCRLRWINYLRPDIRRGKFSPEEERLIIKLHSIVGNRWAHIATHLPGRTDNEIKNYWNSWIKKKLAKSGIDPKNSTDQVTTIEMSNILSEQVDMFQEDPNVYMSSYINAASSQSQLYTAAGDLPHAVSNLMRQDSKVFEFLQDYNISNTHFANSSTARRSADRDDKSVYNIYNNGSSRATDHHDQLNLCSIVQEKLAADSELAPEWSSDNMYLTSCEPALLEYGNGDHINTASRVKNQIMYNDDFQLIKGLQIPDRNVNHNSNAYSTGDLMISPGNLANSINTSYETTAASANLDIYELGRGLSTISPFPTDSNCLSVDVNQHEYGSCCAAYNLPQLLENCEEWADADMKFGSNSGISNADGTSGFSDVNRLRVGNTNDLSVKSLQSSCSTEACQALQIPINMNRKIRRDLPLESAIAGNSVERPAESSSTAMSTLQWYESPAHSLFFNSEHAAAQRMFDPLGAIDQSLAITSDQSISASSAYNINGRPSDDLYKNSPR